VLDGRLDKTCVFFGGVGGAVGYHGNTYWHCCSYLESGELHDPLRRLRQTTQEVCIEETYLGKEDIEVVDLFV